MRKLRRLIEQWKSRGWLAPALELEDRLKRCALDADWYWDDRDLESAIDSIEECVSYDDPGDEIKLRPLIELPEITVLVGDHKWTVKEGKS